MRGSLDIAVPGFGLVGSSPFVAAGAFEVKLSGGHPILCRQTRVGKDGLILLRTPRSLFGRTDKGAAGGWRAA